MLMSALKPVTTLLLGGGILPVNPVPPAQPTPVVQTDTPPTTPPGVTFDLSDAALQTAGSAPPRGEVFEFPEKIPPFLPAAMTIAAEIAALQAAQAATLRTPPTSPAPSATAAGPASAGTVTPDAHAQGRRSLDAGTNVPQDPDEEARARARAIGAQERERLLDVVDRLDETPVDAETKPARTARPAEGGESVPVF